MLEIRDDPMAQLDPIVKLELTKPLDWNLLTSKLQGTSLENKERKEIKQLILRRVPHCAPSLKQECKAFLRYSLQRYCDSNSAPF